MTVETNVTCEEYQLSLEQNKNLKDYEWGMEIFGNLPIAMAGVFLNSVAVLVLSTSSMHGHFFNRLLSILAIFDTIYLSCEISEVLRHIYSTSGQMYACTRFTYPVRNLCMFSSILMTNALALERYGALKNPVEYHNRASNNINRRLLYYVLPILTFSTVYYTPKFLELNVKDVISCTNDTNTSNLTILEETHTEVTKNVNCTTAYHLIPTELRMNQHYVFWYMNVSNVLFTAIMPLCALGYLNFSVHKSLKGFMKRQPSQQSNSSNGRENRKLDHVVNRTYIQFSIVVIFVLSHTLRIVLDINEFLNLDRFKLIQEKGCHNADKLWFRIAVPISQFLIILSPSANFFIYSFFDPSFQNVLQECWISFKNMGQRVRENMDRLIRENMDMLRVDHYGQNIHSTINQTENIELSNMNSNIRI